MRYWFPVASVRPRLAASDCNLDHMAAQPCELLWQNFYNPDALPVAQPTVSKHGG